MFNRTSPTEVRGNAGWRVENGQHLPVNLPPVTVEILRARLDAEAFQRMSPAATAARSRSGAGSPKKDMW